MRALFLGVVLVLAQSATGQPLHKCRNADGTTSYQQEPCVGDQTTQAAPRIQQAPTLTPEERARIFGETQPGVVVDESGVAIKPDSLPRGGDSGGLDSSEYRRGNVRGYQCTRPDGSVYHARSCGQTGVREVSPHGRMVWDAVDPKTGRTIQAGMPGRGVVHDQGRTLMPNDVQWRSRTEYDERFRGAKDHSVEVNVDDACRQARAEAARVRRGEADYEARARADRRVTDLCRQGRSLYEQVPNRPNIR